MFWGIELKKNMTGDNLLFHNWYLLGVKKEIQAMPAKPDVSTSHV